MKSAVLDNLLHFKGPYRFLTMYSTLENKIHTAEFVKISTPWGSAAFEACPAVIPFWLGP